MPINGTIAFIDPLDVGLCNCAQCGCTLIGERTWERLRKYNRIDWPETTLGLGRVCQRLEGRPYCKACWAEMTGIRDEGTV